MEKGRALEPLAAAKYEKDTGLHLRDFGELVHPEFPFIRSHIDREIVETGAPWEAKCPISRRFSRWKSEGLPQMLIAQLQLYMGLKKSDEGIWSVLNADLWQSANFPHGADTGSYEIMVEVAVSFWRNHIEKRIPPSGDAITKPLIQFEATPGELVRIETPDFIRGMELLKEAKAFVAKAADLEEIARDNVKAALGDEKGKYICSLGKLYWTDQQGRRTFDHKRLAQAKPLDRNRVSETLLDVLGPKQFRSVADALKGCDLDVEAFFAQGEPFEQMRPYFSKAVEGEE